jgi:flavin reductase (DIM6/NTAB) family NADH-FMN oxidoreductase RutF
MAAADEFTPGRDQPQPRQDRRPVSSDAFREVIGHFTTGVTVVSAVADGRLFGTTASAVTSLSLEPPMVVICMNESSESGAAIMRAGHFGLSILSESQSALARHFARKGTGKFDGVKIAAGQKGVPLLADALATLECDVVNDVRGGTHIVFLAEVTRMSVVSGAPLAYFRGRFGRFAPFGDEG